MEIDVNPGSVLISLSTTRPSRVKKKSTRERPVQPIAAKARTAVCRMRSDASPEMRAGIYRSVESSRYLPL